MAHDMTEDEVRDLARGILCFEGREAALSGVGQLTTFNQLGFKGVLDKPDGWYLPENRADTAVVLETKASKIALGQAEVDEVLKNVRILQRKYKRVVGVLYNGYDTRVFKGEEEYKAQGSNVLHNVEYYLDLFNVDTIDKEYIYELTSKINDCLHFEFGVKNLYQRMIFTACALVAERYGVGLFRLVDLGYQTFHTAIHSTLAKSLEDSRNQNVKIDILLEEYSSIKMNTTDNQEAINNFIGWVIEISECVNSSEWRGEDVMGIFFNEFNRYKKKSESGQVFTPEHITDFMYRILEVNQDDRVLDATCGSGGFLVKAMANMIQEAGGVKTDKAKRIKQEQLFGIEFDREIYALACANMLIHKDGKTNLEQLDARCKSASKWIARHDITKVLMNPPYENKYGCMTIVENVLDSVPPRTACAFILPDKKLEKASKAKVKRILSHHRLKKIIKLPEDLFFGVGVTTSIFVFETGVAQNGKDIFACHMEVDGLTTVKNKGRHDVYGRWPSIEERWMDVVEKQTGDDTCQWINPEEHLSYQMPQKPFEVFEEDFKKTAMDYLMFREAIDAKDFGERLLHAAMYASTVVSDAQHVTISVPADSQMEHATGSGDMCFDSSGSVEDVVTFLDVNSWGNFQIGDLFESEMRGKSRQVPTGGAIPAKALRAGGTPRVTVSGFNNGVIGSFADMEHVNYRVYENFISVSFLGTVFYQEERTSLDMKVHCLKPLGIQLNRNIGCFLVSVIRASISRFVYQDQLSSTVLPTVDIKLPVTPSGEPDWAFMDSFMQRIFDRSEESLRHLTSILGRS